MVRHTAFLVRIADAAEAETALAAGADRLGLTDACGALDIGSVADIVRMVTGRCPVSAAPQVLGSAMEPAQAAQALAEAGIDAIEFDVAPDPVPLVANLRARYPRLLAVAAVQRLRADLPLGRLAESGFHAARLAPTSEGGARLIEEPGIEALAAFVEAAQRRGLAAWIGGALEAPDVPRMLALQPDVLAFRTGLCRDGRRDAPLDPARLAEMRALIPRARVSQPAKTARGAPTAERARAADKVFVRDFVVEAGIGAYRYEHRVPQRMRFNVEADLAPIPNDVADMRDVFSYDVIVDAIRLATRRHVILVERIALDVANATLRDVRVRRVRVRVEKIDILEGAIGVEIERDASDNIS